MRALAGARAVTRAQVMVRGVAAVCVVAVVTVGVSGCRHRLADRSPSGPPAQTGSTASVLGSTGTSTGTGTNTGPEPNSGPSQGQASPTTTPSSPGISQQDLDSLNGILGSVGGAASSVRSAVAGDTASPQG